MALSLAAASGFFGTPFAGANLSAAPAGTFFSATAPVGFTTATQFATPFVAGLGTPALTGGAATLASGPLTVTVVSTPLAIAPPASAFLSPLGFALLSTTPPFFLAGAGLIVGSARDDVLPGSVGGDTIDGAGGNDVLAGGPGNDLLIGGDGIDTALFDAAFGNMVAVRSGGAVELHNRLTGETDLLLEVEQVQFTDTTAATVQLLAFSDPFV